jgi:preprotein translocase subunit SecF
LNFATEKNKIMNHQELTLFQKVKLTAVLIALLAVLAFAFLEPENSFFSVLLVIGILCGTQILKDLKYKL